MGSFTLVSFICSSTCLCCGCLAPCLKFPGAADAFLSSSFSAWLGRDWALLLWLTRWGPSFIWPANRNRWLFWRNLCHFHGRSHVVWRSGSLYVPAPIRHQAQVPGRNTRICGSGGRAWAIPGGTANVAHLSGLLFGYLYVKFVPRRGLLFSLQKPYGITKSLSSLEAPPRREENSRST